MGISVPPLGQACSWCHTSDWTLGEQAMRSEGGPLSAVFHDRSPEAVEGAFQKDAFQEDAFQVDGPSPRHCWADAVAAGVAI